MPIIIFFKGFSTAYPVMDKESNSKIVNFNTSILRHSTNMKTHLVEYPTWAKLCANYIISVSKSNNIACLEYNEDMCKSLKDSGETVIAVYPSKDIRQQYLDMINNRDDINDDEYKYLCSHYYKMIRMMQRYSNIRYQIDSVDYSIEDVIKEILHKLYKGELL